MLHSGAWLVRVIDCNRSHICGNTVYVKYVKHPPSSCTIWIWIKWRRENFSSGVHHETHRTSATYTSVPHSILYLRFSSYPAKKNYSAFGPSRRIVRRVGTRSHLPPLPTFLFTVRRSKKSRPLPARRADYANITTTIIKCIRILIFSSSSSSSSVAAASQFCSCDDELLLSVVSATNRWTDGVRRPLFSTSPSSLLCVIFSTHANLRPRPLPFVRRRVEKNRAARRWKNAVTPPRRGKGAVSRTGRW